MNGENAQDYLDWSAATADPEHDDSAEFFIEQTEIDAMERQLIDTRNMATVISRSPQGSDGGCGSGRARPFRRNDD